MSIREKSDPDPRDLFFLEYVTRRREGQTDEEIARVLGCNSVQELWQRLAEPKICPDCGERYPEKRHACNKPAPKGAEGRQARQARPIKGTPEELPDAAGAVPLFQQALGKMRRDMAWLEVRRELLKGRRFVAEHQLSGERGESVRIYRRGRTDPETWRAWCEERGLDPEADAHQMSHDVEAPLGVPKDSPAWPVPELVGLYVLAYGDADEALLGTLHPDPGRVDKAELLKEVAWLRRHTELVAALVCGAPAGQSKAWKRGNEITAVERRLAA